MANDLTGRPWIVDTVGLVKSGRTQLTGFVFKNYTGGAASKATFKDGVRNVEICVLMGDASGASVAEAWLSLHPPVNVLDLTCTAIDSGQVEVVVV